MRIKYDDLVKVFQDILEGRGVSEEDARLAAENFAKNSADGVYSHGVNRFPRVISYIDQESIHINGKPECEQSFGALERWNGNLGLGNVNAGICMDRAIELAKEYGIGAVALQNTNHWMRGGTYGWQAADAGCIGICWTNTMPNMPPWGAKDSKIGNNPFIMAIPKSDGKHVVVDCAVAQFSYGKIEECRLKGEQLPVPGGFDTLGNITTDPAEIEKTWRVLPIGYWKGSGLSIALDLIGAVLSGGNTVTDIGRKYEDEIGLTQMFIAIDPGKMNTKETTDAVLDMVLQDIKASEPDKEDGSIRYPGEQEYLTRMDNMKHGIPVLDEVWETITALQKN